ncbi:putative reverse transcriptase domain-containing protein [Tanacetum coccineum]
MALLAQSFRATLPQTNNQLRTSSNTRNQATIQDGRVVVQNVQGRQNQNQRYFARGNGTAGNGGAQNRAGNANAGQGKPVKCYNCNGVGHIARNCTQPKRPQNSDYFKDKMLLMQAQENGAVLDEEELLFLAGEQGNTFDADPFVINQDPGQNSSQSPPHIDHHCCYGCGDSLDDIFCQRCTCESCGKGAHYGYNCPPQVPIISKPEPCNNQTVNEFPQTLPSVHPTSYFGDENSFTYDSKPNFVDDSPNVFNPPPQPPMYSCEFYGNDARYGHYCTPQVPFIYPEPCYNQDFNFPQDFHDFQQQYLCCENCGGPHETFECQPLNYYEPNPCYDSNYSGYDQFDNFHPQQYLCCENCGGPHETYQCQPMNEDYYHEQNSCYDPNSFGFDQFLPQPLPVIDPTPLEKGMEELRIAFQAWSDNIRQKKEEEEKRIAEEQASKDRYWKIPICYDDDEDYTIAITPVSSTKEPVNSLSIGDEHLDTILATELDKVIKSSVENLVLILCESEGIPDSVCDMPLCNNHTPLEAFKEHSEIIVDFNNDSTSSDDDFPYGEDIDYVDASPPDADIVSLEVVEIVILEVGGIDDDILLTIKDDILREKLLNVNLLIANIEALKDNPTPLSDVMTKSPSTFPNSFLEETNTFDNSLTKSETFRFNLEDISSGSTTTRSDYSLPNYEAFYLDDDHIEEKSSGNTTTQSDISLSKYDSFIFDLSINPFPPADRSDVI